MGPILFQFSDTFYLVYLNEVICFADDSLFCKADVHQCDVLKSINNRYKVQPNLCSVWRQSSASLQTRNKNSLGIHKRGMRMDLKLSEKCVY